VSTTNGATVTELGAAIRQALPELYLTPRQVGEILQISIRSVYRLSSTDATMPTLRLGGTVRFPRAELLKWLQARTQGRAAR